MWQQRWGGKGPSNSTAPRLSLNTIVVAYHMFCAPGEPPKAREEEGPSSSREPRLAHLLLRSPIQTQCQRGRRRKTRAWRRRPWGAGAAYELKEAGDRQKLSG